MKQTEQINPDDYASIIFFTGAGMSAESGVPVYRGNGGIWEQYRWEDYACQKAFEMKPEQVLDFHELRRKSVLQCSPHTGHTVIAGIQKKHTDTWIVTQNIDGMHQRAGANNVIELHGSLWRLRCEEHGITEDYGEQYDTRVCTRCGKWLRPDIIWFEDMLDERVLQQMEALMKKVSLFVSIGTSGVVYPAAIFPALAKQVGAKTACINTELPADNSIFDFILQGNASTVLKEMFSEYVC